MSVLHTLHGADALERYAPHMISSHRQYKHPTKPGRVTVSGHLADDMPLGTLKSVMREAGLKREISK